MANKITISNKFYKHLKEFMKDIIMVFPDDREIKMISSSINIATIDDEEYEIIYSFHKALKPLETLIVNRNDDLFNNDPSIYWENGSNQYQLFSKLNVYWDSVNDINKKIIWDYIQLLYSLSTQIL